MMRISNIIILLVSVLTLSACTSDAPIEPKQVKFEQLQQDWDLTHIDNIRLATVIDASLKIGKDGKASGNLGCNNFFGVAEFNNNKIRINNMGSTRKMCDELKNSVELDVEQVLNDWATVMLDKTTLIISNQKHSLTYQLKP